MPGKKGIVSKLLHPAARKPRGRSRRAGRESHAYKHGIFAQDTEFTPDEVEFMLAMDKQKRDSRRQFPTWSDALAVLKKLGYRKVTS